MASEAGVLPVAPERVLQKGRLQPGRMFLVDTEQGRIVADEELKKKIRRAHTPTRRGSTTTTSCSKICRHRRRLPRADHRRPLASATGLRLHLRGLADPHRCPWPATASQPLGSMGNDTPLAVLSNQPQLLYNYFKQLFAQVTNPPIDPIREEIIISTETMVGARGNLLDPDARTAARMIKLKYPILTNEELEKLRHVNRPGFKAVTLPILFHAADGGERPRSRRWTSLFAAADQRHRRRREYPHPFRPRRERRTGAHPRPAGRRPACIII